MRNIKLTFIITLLLVFITNCSNDDKDIVDSSISVNIPDSNFKDYLLKNSMINTNNDSEIQVKEAQNFTGIINCQDKKINDLTGIEHFINLKELVCSKNNLKSIDISKNTKLVTLQCDKNKLTSLNLSKNKLLSKFIVSYNPIEELNIQYCSAITDFECTNMPYLRTINLKGINLEQINIFNPSYNSQLSCIVVDNLYKAYERTRYYDWKILESPKATYKNDCSSNNTSTNIVNIPDINFKARLVANKKINVNGDGEIQIEEAENCSGALHVRDNNIRNLKGIKYFKNITSLDCGANDLTTLDVSKNVKLVRLICDHNNKKLEKLILPNSKSLALLACEGNKLKNLDLNDKSNLSVIYCDDNEISSLMIDKLEKLETLECNNNKLKNLTFSQSNKKLNKLIVSNNPMKTLSIGNIPKLRSFECTHMPNLEYINAKNVYSNDFMLLFDISHNNKLKCVEVYNPELSKKRVNKWKRDKSPNVIYSKKCN